VDEIGGPVLPRQLALLAEAERRDGITRSPRVGTAGFVLGAAVGLLNGAALDELAWALAADDGRGPAAPRAAAGGGAPPGRWVRRAEPQDPRRTDPWTGPTSRA
jgi:hypothetical protein